MEEELHQEITEEERLSQLWGRKVTLEGLQMFVKVIHPKAEKLVQTFLPSLQSKLLRIFGGIQLPPDSAGDAKSAELLELEHITAPVIPEVVNITVKFFLEELEMEEKIKAASAEVGRLLTGTAAPFLSQYGDISRYLLLGVCTTAGRYMVRAIFKEMELHSKTFKQIDNESAFCLREGVISAIQDMDPEVQTPASSQSSSEWLKEGLLEERGASPEVSATNVFVVVASAESLNEAPLEESETSPEVALRESLQEEHLEEMVASPEFKVLQEEVEAENVIVKKKKKKERMRAFFRGIWRKMSCCF
ncbi:uncharacterized protein LOC122990560 [Scomber scombrus]|uniref:Uncharacterized protein LOC122990560 n=1 Tax=Scomber scombrus TaxID=13677 RepID=A0AAV1PRX9_SCOSC